MLRLLLPLAVACGMPLLPGSARQRPAPADAFGLMRFDPRTGLSPSMGTSA